MKNLCLTIAIICLSFHSFSQPKVKWGKYSEKELSMKSCSFEEGAKAIILYEDGFLEYRSRKYVTSIHRRLKIFDKSEVKRGVIRIAFNPQQEEIVGIEGITSVFLNGNVVNSKLRDDQITLKKIADDQAEMVIKMPVVRAGSIIEYKYRKQSKSVAKLANWNFQHDIPTLYSSYRQSTDFPEEFDFSISFEGIRTLTEEIYKGVETVSGDRATTLTRIQNGAVAQKGISKWELKNVNSLRMDDPFLFSPEDYLERIVFRKRGDSKKINSWEKLIINYLNNQTVLKLINGNDGEISNLIANISTSATADEKMREVHSIISKNFEWSGKLGFTPDGKINSADVNLRLYSALKSIFDQVSLVLVSTPENGVVYQGFPLENPFDHVVVKVTENNKTFFLDATDQYLPYTVLPAHSNGRSGLSLEKERKWVITKSTYNWKNAIYQQITFNGSDFKKEYNVKWDETNTASFRKQIAAGNENYYKKMFEIPEMRKISEHKTGNLNSDKGPLNTVFSYEFSNYLKEQDKIYISPIEFQELLINPLNEPKRNYPIQYSSLPGIQVSGIIEIPAGYSIEKLPEAISIGLPDSFGKFTYKAVSAQGKINLLVRFEILKNDIPAELYPALKGLYKSMTDKCKESIVFKKL